MLPIWRWRRFVNPERGPLLEASLAGDTRILASLSFSLAHASFQVGRDPGAQFISDKNVKRWLSFIDYSSDLSRAYLPCWKTARWIFYSNDITVSGWSTSEILKGERELLYFQRNNKFCSRRDLARTIWWIMDPASLSRCASHAMTKFNFVKTCAGTNTVGNFHLDLHACSGKRRPWIENFKLNVS